MNVLLELADGFCRERVRDNFALSSVLCAISGVEQASLDGHECIIIFTVRSAVSLGSTVSYIPLQEATAMTVDGLYCIRIRNRYMIWLDPDDLPILLVSIVNRPVPPAMSTLPHQPQIAELCWERTWHAKNCLVSDVRKNIV